ncbi:hypothetical protein IE81DRAFT_363458 [Ceraceosorus guamensis]|uniref:Uncharacterized protein n=1 Tax=Ceraceosorus guamensis TaxID=1522189 RepID=A0A316W808_9BASI|nr:hypothetical protein IE81DRAFT_363458 [Ceraceosorus guamensis]PWN46027.1 hypothetical protein IE81DRAFT_363458 [Ceraceosorus guamensis]
MSTSASALGNVSPKLEAPLAEASQAVAREQGSSADLEDSSTKVSGPDDGVESPTNTSQVARSHPDQGGSLSLTDAKSVIDVSPPTTSARDSTEAKAVRSEDVGYSVSDLGAVPAEKVVSETAPVTESQDGRGKLPTTNGTPAQTRLSEASGGSAVLTASPTASAAAAAAAAGKKFTSLSLTKRFLGKASPSSPTFNHATTGGSCTSGTGSSLLSNSGTGSKGSFTRESSSRGLPILSSSRLTSAKLSASAAPKPAATWGTPSPSASPAINHALPALAAANPPANTGPSSHNNASAAATLTAQASLGLAGDKAKASEPPAPSAPPSSRPSPKLGNAEAHASTKPPSASAKPTLPDAVFGEKGPAAAAGTSVQPSSAPSAAEALSQPASAPSPALLHSNVVRSTHLSSPRLTALGGARSGSPARTDTSASPSLRNAALRSSANDATSGAPKSVAPWATSKNSSSSGARAPSSERIASSDFPTAAEAQNVKEATDEHDRLASARTDLDRFRGANLGSGRHWDEMVDEDGGFLDEVVEFGDGTQYKVPQPSLAELQKDARPVTKEDRFRDQTHDRSWPPPPMQRLTHSAASSNPTDQPSPSFRKPASQQRLADYAPEVATKSLFPQRAGRSSVSAFADEGDSASVELLPRDRRGSDWNSSRSGRPAGGLGGAHAHPDATLSAARAWGPLARRTQNLDSDAPRREPSVTSTRSDPRSPTSPHERPLPAKERAPLPTSKPNARTSERPLPPHMAAGLHTAADRVENSPEERPYGANASEPHPPVASKALGWGPLARRVGSPSAQRTELPVVESTQAPPSRTTAAATETVSPAERAERARRRRAEEEAEREREKARALEKAKALELQIEEARRVREIEDAAKEAKLREEQAARIAAQDARMLAARKQAAEAHEAALKVAKQDTPAKSPEVRKSHGRPAPGALPEAISNRQGPSSQLLISPSEEATSWRRAAPLAQSDAIVSNARRAPSKEEPSPTQQSRPRTLLQRPPTSQSSVPSSAPSMRAEQMASDAVSATKASLDRPQATTSDPSTSARQSKRAEKQAQRREAGAKQAQADAALANAAPPAGPRALRNDVANLPEGSKVVAPTAPRVAIIAPTDENASARLQTQRHDARPPASSATQPLPSALRQPARPRHPEPVATRTEVPQDSVPVWNRFVVKMPAPRLRPARLSGPAFRAQRQRIAAFQAAANSSSDVDILSWTPSAPGLPMKTLSIYDQFHPKKYRKGVLLANVSMPTRVLPRNLPPRVFPTSSATAPNVPPAHVALPRASAHGRATQRQPMMYGHIAEPLHPTSVREELHPALEADMLDVKPTVKLPRGNRSANIQPSLGRSNAQSYDVSVPVSGSSAVSVPTAPASMRARGFSGTAPRGQGGPLDWAESSGMGLSKRALIGAGPPHPAAKGRRDSGAGVAFARSANLGHTEPGSRSPSFVVASELELNGDRYAPPANRAADKRGAMQTPILPSPGQLSSATWGGSSLNLSGLPNTAANGGASPSHLESLWATPDLRARTASHPAQNSLRGIADDFLSMPTSIHDLGAGDSDGPVVSLGGLGAGSSSANNQTSQSASQQQRHGDDRGSRHGHANGTLAGLNLGTSPVDSAQTSSAPDAGVRGAAGKANDDAASSSRKNQSFIPFGHQQPYQPEAYNTQAWSQANAYPRQALSAQPAAFNGRAYSNYQPAYNFGGYPETSPSSVVDGAKGAPSAPRGVVGWGSTVPHGYAQQMGYQALPQPFHSPQAGSAGHLAAGSGVSNGDASNGWSSASVPTSPAFRGGPMGRGSYGPGSGSRGYGSRAPQSATPGQMGHQASLPSLNGHAGQGRGGMGRGAGAAAPQSRGFYTGGYSNVW